MAGLRTAIQELLTLIETSSVKFARVFNNQFQYMEDGSIESFPMPCVFVEALLPNDNAGLGATVTDVTFRIHIGMNELDAQDGTLEQNVNIFALRDEMVALLTYKMLSGCSGLQKVSESMDYTHTNVYHYVLEFVCSFVDVAGDQTVTQEETTPPTVLETTIDIVTSIT